MKNILTPQEIGNSVLRKAESITRFLRMEAAHMRLLILTQEMYLNLLVGTNQQQELDTTSWTMSLAEYYLIHAIGQVVTYTTTIKLLLLSYEVKLTYLLTTLLFYHALQSSWRSIPSTRSSKHWQWIASSYWHFSGELMKHLAKVRYTDKQGRSHFVEVESDLADRQHIEELVRCRYPADKVYFQGVYAK